MAWSQWWTGLVPTQWPESPGSCIPLSQGATRPGLFQDRPHWGYRPGYGPHSTVDLILAEIRAGKRDG